MHRKEDLIRLTDLEEETINRVIDHIQHEFEQGDTDEEELTESETEAESHGEELPADQEVSEEEE